MANPAARAMQRISPWRISKRRDAFSLVELLVAMAILAILVAASSRGLVTSMIADETSVLVFDGTLALNRCEAGIARGDDAKTLGGAGWERFDVYLKPEDSNAVPWRVISLQSQLRPSLRIQMAIRAD